MKKALWLELCCVLLILLFTYASLTKVIPFWHFTQFKHDMHNQPFANWFTLFLSYALPIVEFGIAASLISTRLRRTGLLLSIAFMSLFTLYAALILIHAFPYVPCGCGGLIGNLQWPQHLLFNLFFTAIALTGFLLERNKSKTDRPDTVNILHGHV